MPDPRLATLQPNGRHYTHPRTREVVPSVTTILNIVAKPGLDRWRANIVAAEAWRHREWLVTVDEPAAVGAISKAADTARDKAGEHGRFVHEGCELIAMSQAGVELTPEQTAKLVALLTAQGDAVRDGLLRFGEWAGLYVSEWLHLEQTVFGVGYAGTFDAIVRLRDGRTCLLDYKTSSGVFPETVLQLAAYRHGEAIYRADGTRIEIPDVDVCAVVHLPQAGGYAFLDMQVMADDYITFAGLVDAHAGLEQIPARPGRPIPAPSPNGEPAEQICHAPRSRGASVRCTRPDGHAGDHQGPGPSGTRVYTWGESK